MELRDFVAESIKQIVDGVNEAKHYAAEKGGTVNPERQIHNSNNAQSRTNAKTGASIETIEFDVAVTVTEGTQTKGSIGIFMGAVGLGSQGQSNAANSSITRLRFSVPISLPSTPNPSDRR
jgi:hypothetical protein